MVGNGKTTEGEDKFELFKIKEDPYELNNIGEDNPVKVRELKNEMDSWFDEMVNSPNFVKSPRAIVGSENENPTILNLNDATFVKYDELKQDVASWEIVVTEAGKYDIVVHFTKNIVSNCQVELQIAGLKQVFDFSESKQSMLKIESIELLEGEADIIPIIWIKEPNKRVYKKPFYLEVNKK